MVPENEESNPFESPAAKTPAHRQPPWLVLYGATGIFVLVGVLCAFFETLLMLLAFIVAVGLPALVRTISDLNRKLAAGWLVDYGVQWKSLGVSLGVSMITIISAGVAGTTVCASGIAVANVGQGQGEMFGIVLMFGAIPVGLALLGWLFYRLGPKKLEVLQQEANRHGGEPPISTEPNQSQPSP
ncbi:hypothetical protein Enr8_34130 [Blastopirellula retiformator]|uniref:Uncharacterized protein n=2 Tax=Blastopirellula retiformator TaxID=2527970 RepID=A0A5C5V177_9BACT|nr:hypothetical protein Enr8_34130 [Blastopirellula retiformator]